ncbi:MAG: phosphatidate cytidylyltransferase [Bacteroidales bacterium]
MTPFLRRTISGLIYVAGVTAAIWTGPPFFALMLTFMATIALKEYDDIVSPTTLPVRPILLPSFIVSLGLILLATAGYLPARVALPLIIPVFMLPMLAPVIFPQVRGQGGSEKAGLAMAWILFPLLSLLAFYLLPAGGQIKRLLLLGLFAQIWLYDTMAYIIGSWLGRHHLAPHISPGKTWEGVAGGIAGAIVTAWIFSTFSDHISLLVWIAMALISIVFGTFGDLFESLLKRRAGKKEAGNIIPGHGGMLDRIDSILIAAPFAWALLYIYLSWVK